MSKVSFDGANKLVICNAGVTSLAFAADVYSAWKLWVATGNNSKFLPAISVVGGDPITGSINLGSTFFLENGWKIRPQEANHNLVVKGNIYSRDGLSPFVPTLGNYNVLTELSRSNIIDTVVSGSGVTSEDKADIIRGVWQEMITNHLEEGSTGKALSTASSGGVDYNILSSAVWDKSLSEHEIEGSAGKALSEAGITDQDKSDIKNLVFNSIIESSLTLEDMIKLMFAVLVNKSTGGGTTHVTFRDILDQKDRLSTIVDENGNRINVVLDVD